MIQERARVVWCWVGGAMGAMGGKVVLRGGRGATPLPRWREVKRRMLRGEARWAGGSSEGEGMAVGGRMHLRLSRRAS